MIMPNDIAKIGDLGIAKVLSKTAAAKTQIGTPHYMPPEIWKNQPYGFSSDSWAMGCLLYEMMTLKVWASVGGSLRCGWVWGSTAGPWAACWTRDDGLKAWGRTRIEEYCRVWAGVGRCGQEFACHSLPLLPARTRCTPLRVQVPVPARQGAVHPTHPPLTFTFTARKRTICPCC